MAVEEREYAATEHVASLAAEREHSDGLVLYPDQVTSVGDELVAGFRNDAQALRVAAMEAGIPVDVALPKGARAGQYSEHAADWVMSLIGVPPSVVATLIATSIQRRLDAWHREKPDSTPTLRYREVESKPDGEARVREIEGPADEVLEWLRQERCDPSQLDQGEDDA